MYIKKYMYIRRYTIISLMLRNQIHNKDQKNLACIKKRPFDRAQNLHRKNRVCKYVKTKCCIYKFSHFLINHNFDPCSNYFHDNFGHSFPFQSSYVSAYNFTLLLSSDSTFNK